MDWMSEMEAGLEKAWQWLTIQPVEYYWALGGLVALFVIYRIARNLGRKSRKKKQAPKLVVEDYRVSPLGRDAFLKVKNEGATATVGLLKIQTIPGVKIKNQLAGQVLEKGAPCRILLESDERSKLMRKLSFEVTLLGPAGKVFKQRLTSGKPK